MVLGNKQLMGLGGGITVTPEFIQSGDRNDSASSNTLNIPYPPSPTSGNLLICTFYIYTGGGTYYLPTTPSGWTLEASNTNYSYLGVLIYSKVSDGTETGNVTFSTLSSNTRMFGLISEYTFNTGIYGIDIQNGNINSSNTINNSNSAINSNDLYVIFHGQTSTTSITFTLGNYTIDTNGNDGLNSTALISYYTSNNDDDGSVTISATSFNIQGAFIIN